MLILGTFYLIINTIDQNFRQIDGLTTIEVHMDLNYDEEQASYVGAALQKIADDLPIVEECRFVSRAEHMRIMQEKYGEYSWMNEFNEENNPLRDSYQLKFRNFSEMDEVYKIKYQIENIKFEDGTQAIRNADVKDYITLYENVMSVKNTMYVVGLWLMAILLLISLFVIMNTIKLGVFARRNEIMFMRYCGATKAFIRAPFIVEGVIIGIFSAGLALGIEFYLYQFVLRDLITSASGAMTSGSVIIAPFFEHLPLVAGAFLAIGLFAGIISSSLSLKKYLKV